MKFLGIHLHNCEPVYTKKTVTFRGRRLDEYTESYQYCEECGAVFTYDENGLVRVKDPYMDAIREDIGQLIINGTACWYLETTE